MYQYLDALKTILKHGDLVPNRTGVSAITYPHIMIRHDMSDGFPLLTTKKMAWKSMKVELEFFIKGLTDKKWLQDRGCHIWDEWCNPSKVPTELAHEERKKFQLEETDLGKVYGYQWRNFNSQGIDQLENIVKSLKSTPYDRRCVCLSWNPAQLKEQALPACHTQWVISATKNKLHLAYSMRSTDFFLGAPFNQSSYALLLHLLCKETGFGEGVVSGFFANAHIYETHISAVEEQLSRKPFGLPKIETKSFKSIFDWTYKDTELINYECHPAIKAPIAV